jgi:hypothetical protein
MINTIKPKEYSAFFVEGSKKHTPHNNNQQQCLEVQNECKQTADLTRQGLP